MKRSKKADRYVNPLVYSADWRLARLELREFRKLESVKRDHEHCQLQTKILISPLALATIREHQRIGNLEGYDTPAPFEEPKRKAFSYAEKAGGSGMGCALAALLQKQSRSGDERLN
jgi:hypothetical protein